MPALNPTTSVEFRTIDRLLGYRYGSDGSVWSSWCRIGLGDGGGFRFTLDGPWKPIKIRYVTGRYPSVNLKGLSGSMGTHQVHRLILEAFSGPCPPGMEARHLDGDRTNNRSDNLCWGTGKENAADKRRHGTILFGQKLSWSKLTEDDVRAIRRELMSGKKGREIARHFGVSPSNISAIRKGKAWAWIE